MNFAEVLCFDVIKPDDAERNCFRMMINFDTISWYCETEDLLYGESTNFIKFAATAYVFLTTMPITEFEKYLHKK